MHTTLDIPDPLFREVKARAAREGLKLKELLARYVEAGLREGNAAPDTSPKRRAPLPVAIRRNPATPPTPALTNQELNAILDEEDLKNYLRVSGRSGNEP